MPLSGSTARTALRRGMLQIVNMPGGIAGEIQP